MFCTKTQNPMKNPMPFLPVFVLALATFSIPALAQLNIPSDGSDGMLDLTTNTVIDLSQAVPGVWTNNNSANAGKGIYDPTQWAVVFKYSSVNIQGVLGTNGGTNGVVIGNSLTFLNHPTHAPVIWLVQGNVTINGILNLNGTPGPTGVPQVYTPAEPGPGGFRGGAISPAGEGAGYGPGADGSTGLYSLGLYSGAYGNPQILPLIGGSGSGSINPLPGPDGSAGGGAILIMASGIVTINGFITANGAGVNYVTGSHSDSSGGAVRIVANQILGTGTIDASQPEPGRTRMEANKLSPQLNIFPNAAAVPPGTTPVIFPPANAPTVAVVSVDSQAAPLDPLAAVVSSADIGIQNNNPVNIILQTQNLPIQGVVTLHITPKYASGTFLNATYVSGDINKATWQVTTSMPQGFCVLQARATAP
jgi:hypothetical protein